MSDLQTGILLFTAAVIASAMGHILGEFILTYFLED